jgi:transcriptional regulator with XRE-family HTH domain
MNRKEVAMVATLTLRRDQLTKIRRWNGVTTDAALAAKMGIDAGNLSRVLSDKHPQQPGPKFIAALCSALDAELGDLFEVVNEDAA